MNNSKGEKRKCNLWETNHTPHAYIATVCRSPGNGLGMRQDQVVPWSSHTDESTLVSGTPNPDPSFVFVGLGIEIIALRCYTPSLPGIIVPRSCLCF